MTSQLDDWFSNDVLRWRIFAASVWSVFLGLFWTVIFSLVLLVVQNPLEAVSVGLSLLASLLTASSWFYLSLMVLCLIVWTNLQSTHTSVEPSVWKSVVVAVSSSFTRDVLPSFIQFIGFGLAVSWCLLKVCGSKLSNLYTHCGQTGELCFNHAHLFLLLAGAYSGLLEAVEFHYKNGNYMNLPIIGLDRYTQLKLKLEPRLFSLVWAALHSAKYFYPLYLVVAVLLGGIYRPAGLGYSDLVSPALLLSCWIILLFVKVVSVSISACLAVHCTTPLHLDLQNLLQGSNSDSSLLSVLCLQNLSEVACELSDVRREIFSLSLPGGHPHSWNSVLAACFRRLRAFNKDLTDLLCPPSPAAPKVEELVSNPGIEVLSPNIRRLAPISQKQISPVPASPTLETRLASQWDAMVDSLKRRPLIGWLINQPQDVAFKQVFARSQSMIFCVEILSFIISHSITEDKYGVVQKDLPDILNCLLSLEQNIDRVRGPGIVYRKKTVDQPDVHLKQELKCAVKSAIFRIVISFKEHILSVPVSPEYSQKVHGYLHFLEA